MPLIESPGDIPRLADVFSQDHTLLTTLRKARITNVIPLTLLSRETLMQLNGIGHKSARRITELLHDAGLDQYVFSQSLTAFVNQTYGSIEDTPVSALHVVTVRDHYLPVQVYAPLPLITFLSEFEPHMVISDLLGMTRQQIQAFVNESTAAGPVRECVTADIQDINRRLGWWGPELRINDAVRHLRAIN